MDEKPKLESWNYDEVQQRPELQAQKAVSWSAVSENMVKDTTEHTIKRISFSVIGLITVWIVGRLYYPAGLTLALLLMIPIIRATIHGNRRPSKRYEVAFWILITIGVIIVM
jgi:hypothetical protein